MYYTIDNVLHTYRVEPIEGQIFFFREKKDDHCKKRKSSLMGTTAPVHHCVTRDEKEKNSLDSL